MIIGIAGGSGAGKTTVARTVAERMGEENVGYLSQDWYYLDHSNMSEEEIAKENLDHPDAFDSKLLVKHLRDIKERSKTYDETIKRYLSSVKPMHDAFVEPSKRFADIIVPRGGDNELATDLLSDFVEHYTIHKSL